MLRAILRGKTHPVQPNRMGFEGDTLRTGGHCSPDGRAAQRFMYDGSHGMKTSFSQTYTGEDVEMLFKPFSDRAWLERAIPLAVQDVYGESALAAHDWRVHHPEV